MRPEDLRPATAQAALKKKHKLEKRLSPGEKKNRKRMASVASVYSIARDARTPCLVAQGSYRTEHKKPKPVGKRVWASIEKPVQRVIYEIFEEAERQDPEHQREWVALVDGNKQQIELLEKEAKQRCIRLCIVLDVMHVLEYIWKAAYAFYPVGSPQAQSAEAVLKLRSLKASGDFTAYWKFHEEQEFNRIHKSKYKNPSVINKLHIKKV